MEFSILMVADDAENALERLAEHTYAVLLSDYELPMILGPELIRLVRQRWPSIRVVLMSSHTHIRQLTEQLDVDGYFTKMNVFELPRILQAVLLHHYAVGLPGPAIGSVK